MDRDEIIAERAKHNLSEFMEHGPGLRWSTAIWVIAKDPEAGKVYLGGLGSMGIGQMWTDDGVAQGWVGETWRDDPTYADAPVCRYDGSR